MDRNLAMEVVRVTEYAALACSDYIGRGDEKAADQAAVVAMRSSLNSLNIDGTVVIGEGERDEAPMLFVGEKVGTGGTAIDIALDPLEGTTICATGGQNSITVIAMAQSGGFLNAPDVYMKKIAVGPDVPRGVLNLSKSISENVHAIQRHLKKPLNQITACVLDRPRHAEIIQELRSLGVKIYLISDGDVSAVISTTDPDSPIDFYIGTGGAPEGVLAAAALQCVGGDMQGQLIFRNDDEIARARKWGVQDLNKIYSVDDLAYGDIMFAATGVTDGTYLRGVRINGAIAQTQSLVMRSKSGTVRTIESKHNLERIKKV